MVSFELGKEIKKDVNSSCHEREKILSRILTQNYFLCLTFVTRRETPFFISLLSSNLTISLNLLISLIVIIYVLICRVGFIIEEVRNINCSHLHLNYISQSEQQVAKLWLFFLNLSKDCNNNLLRESQFTVLRKCQSKFDCLVFEMLFIKKLKPNLNIQTDSIRAKLFVWYFLTLQFFISYCCFFSIYRPKITTYFDLIMTFSQRRNVAAF